MQFFFFWQSLNTSEFPTDDDSEDFIRMKQEQAYRSVGALQLRVEELTLEVTKVRKSVVYFSMEPIKFEKGFLEIIIFRRNQMCKNF